MEARLPDQEGRIGGVQVMLQVLQEIEGRLLCLLQVEDEAVDQLIECCDEDAAASAGMATVEMATAETAKAEAALPGCPVKMASKTSMTRMKQLH